MRRYKPRSCAKHGSEDLNTAAMTTNVSTLRREHRDGELASNVDTINWTSRAGN